MSTLKFKNPETGAWEKLGAPSVDAYSKSETDALIAAAPKGVQLDLLWTNPNPTSAFDAQHVYLDLAGYPVLIIRFAIQAGASDGYQTAVVLRGQEMIANAASQYTRSSGDQGFGASRYVNSNELQVYFDPGKYHTAYSFAQDNKAMVPVQIYGIKGVL